MAEKDFCQIDAAEEKAIEDALENQDLSLALDKIQDYLKQIDNVLLNIAVTGESGSGKSSFINAFRGLGHEEDDSAPTGIVETTFERKKYPHPKYPNVILWDLPGIGTPTFKADQYLVDVEFKIYDFFIIVASDRFRECHVQLASEIKKMKKNFYFLRNKIDNNLNDEKTSKPRTFNEEKTLEAIRQDCIKGLERINGSDHDVFLISCFDFARFDFGQLHETIEKELPMHKREVLLLALPNITMEIIQKKKKALKANIWKVALLSGCVAALPVPGLSFAVDTTILLVEIRKYFKAFHLNDQSLQKLAERSDVPVKELKDEIKYAPLYFKLDGTGVIQLLTTMSQLMTEFGSMFIVSMIPLLGSAAAGGMSFATTYYMLNKCLEELATDAHNVLMKAVYTNV